MKKKHSQHIKGDDSHHLLCPCETSPEVLHPTPDSSAQEGHGHGSGSPEKGHKGDQKAGGPLL